jgi:hypothetical protein
MTDEPSIDVEVLNRLRKPFPPEAVGKLPRVTCKDCRDRKCTTHKPTNCRTCNAYIGKHIHLDYVGHAHVRERLLEVDPGWNWEPLAIDNLGLPAMDANGGMWIRLTVGGVSRLGYGDAPGKRGGDAVKEVIGDALRNAGQSFGIALDLWKKEPAPVHDDQPARQVEQSQWTPEQRVADLRGRIAMFGPNRNRKIEEIGADFFQWSRGTEINRAEERSLEKFLEYLERQAGEESA